MPGCRPTNRLAAVDLHTMDMEQISPDKIHHEYRDTGEAKGESTLRHRMWHKRLSSVEACSGHGANWWEAVSSPDRLLRLAQESSSLGLWPAKYGDACVIILIILLRQL